MFNISDIRRLILECIEEMNHEEWEAHKKTDEYKKYFKDWLERHGAHLDNKGRVLAFHATTYPKAKSIKENGFREGSYFSLKSEYSRNIVKYHHGLKDRGIAVLEVYLPLDAISFVAGDIVADRPIKWEEVI